MSVIFIVLPLALLIGGVAVGACMWAASRGQFDDLDTPPLRVLTEDGDAPGPAAPTPAHRNLEDSSTGGRPARSA
jgi:cbb3-type cytochrome oxidase maturation protein